VVGRSRRLRRLGRLGRDDAVGVRAIVDDHARRAQLLAQLVRLCKLARPLGEQPLEQHAVERRLVGRREDDAAIVDASVAVVVRLARRAWPYRVGAFCVIDRDAGVAKLCAQRVGDVKVAQPFRVEPLEEEPVQRGLIRW